MIAYSIECAIESGLFDTVFVATEDDEIARTAEAHGASVCPESPDMAGDLVGTDEVSVVVWRELSGAGRSYDSIVCLQPSSPLRSPSDLRGAWDAFVAGGADFLVSVTPIDPHYFHWAVHRDGDWWRMVFGDKYMMERPLLPPVHRPNGSIKIARAAALEEVGNFFGPKLLTYETPEERSIHVATQFDLNLAEFLLAERQRSC